MDDDLTKTKSSFFFEDNKFGDATVQSRDLRISLSFGTSLDFQERSSVKNVGGLSCLLMSLEGLSYC